MLTSIKVSAAALLMPLCVHAQSVPPATAPRDTHPLTLAAAIELAVAANPGLRAAQIDVAIADAGTMQADQLPNPELALLQEGTERGSRTRTVQISQRLELGGKRAARLALAASERHVAAQDLAIAGAELRANVMTAYFDVMTAQERLDLAQASLRLAAKATDAATRRVAAGRISPVEQSRSQVAQASVQLEVAQAETGVMLARQRLAALWGDAVPVARPLAGLRTDLPPLPPLELLRERLDAAPQLRRASELVAREDARVRLERTRRVPDLSVTLGNKRDDEIGRHQAVLGLSIPLPLFDRNAGGKLAALRLAEKARADLEAERLRLMGALTDAWQRAQLAQAEVASITRDILPAAQGAYDAAVTGFELGKFSFLDVIDAQRTLFQIRSQYLLALSERCRAGADLERYTATGSSR